MLSLRPLPKSLLHCKILSKTSHRTSNIQTSYRRYTFLRYPLLFSLSSELPKSFPCLILEYVEGRTFPEGDPPSRRQPLTLSKNVGVERTSAVHPSPLIHSHHSTYPHVCLIHVDWSINSVQRVAPLVLFLSLSLPFLSESNDYWDQ